MFVDRFRKQDDRAHAGEPGRVPPVEDVHDVLTDPDGDARSRGLCSAKHCEAVDPVAEDLGHLADAIPGHGELVALASRVVENEIVGARQLGHRCEPAHLETRFACTHEPPPAVRVDPGAEGPLVHANRLVEAVGCRTISTVVQRQEYEVRKLGHVRKRRRDDRDLCRAALAQDALGLIGEELDELEAWQFLEVEAPEGPQPRTAKHTGRLLGEVDRGEHFAGGLRYQLQVTGILGPVNLEELRRVEKVGPGRWQEFVDENRVVVPVHLLRLR